MMAKETTYDKIARLTGLKPTQCNCPQCQNMCHVPCLGTPEDIEKLVDAGYTSRLQPTEWLVGKLVGLTNRSITMIQPKVEKGWCTFYHNGLCELHDKGLKPTEGRLCYHDVTDPRQLDLSHNVAWLVAKEWTDDTNFYTILRLCDKIKKQLK